MDVARAIAIGGMAFVHFVMVLSASASDGSTVYWLFNKSAGRPATLFMILAGIGVSLRFVGKTEASSISHLRTNLAGRGCVFLVVGFVNLMFWPGDILRVYGVAYLVAALLAVSSPSKLLGCSVTILLAFVACVFLFDFETNWDFGTLQYANLWTLRGATMNLFYNGFRAVLPWLGVMFFGMWVGRLDLRSGKVRQRLLRWGVIAWVAAELISFGLLRWITPYVPESEHEALVAMLGTDSLPPMPLFLISSCGFAIVVIAVCVHLCEMRQTRLGSVLAHAGQLAFSWYILHIIVVIGAGLLTDFRGDTPVAIASLVSAVFFCAMCMVSTLYRRRLRYGPLEWCLRKLVP